MEQLRHFRARDAGAEAAAKLSGKQRCVNKTPADLGPQASEPYYVIIRSRSPLKERGYCRSWSRARSLVCHALGIAAEAIFHRFETWEEVLTYWGEVYLGTLPPQL